ncbi:MAG: CehA/McbA family metallohydrolase, partial [Planctomycetes bacterium]|nr:CehA/McbA family metallohydrolase [Planctomycetota bacterium]
ALPGRVYVQAADGTWRFARSESPAGSAVIYDKQRFTRSLEKHTTVSAHPFLVDVPRGRVTVRVERGKEYFPFERTLQVDSESASLKIPLQRWIDMGQAGWYSGDTHVHRTVDELPNLLLAEDLNVGLPLTYWVTSAYTAPTQGQEARPAFEPQPIPVDSTHVIYPINTEYEIFTVGDRQHTLGAIFALGHRKAFEFGVPPVRRFADEAARQGAVLDLDKHSWPWSLMLPPVAGVQLYELANNHCWRTEFGFRNWTAEIVPDFMQIERDQDGLTEWGWIDFGFQTYYALLNCGFRMRPSAGTASGVHPVPLGFGRVYVHLPEGFSYHGWMQGLTAGRSFVTTGPMLMVQVNNQPPSGELKPSIQARCEYRITGRAVSPVPLKPIEIIVAGQISQRVPAANRPTPTGAYESPIDVGVTVERSTWIAVRVFEDRPDQRVRFAHSAPVHIQVADKPLRPRREEVDYLVRRMEDELDRNRGVLSDDALQEYREALSAYRQLPTTGSGGP